MQMTHITYEQLCAATSADGKRPNYTFLCTCCTHVLIPYSHAACMYSYADTCATCMCAVCTCVQCWCAYCSYRFFHILLLLVIWFYVSITNTSISDEMTLYVIIYSTLQ